MMIANKSNIKEPIKNADGELFYELIGRGENLGNATKHSVGNVIVLNGYTTNVHYHPEAEETYYFIKGTGTMIIGDFKFKVTAGDVVLISPNEKYQLIADNGDVEAIVICAPAWKINNTVFVK